MSKEILDIFGRISSNDNSFRKDYNGWVCVVNYILSQGGHFLYVWGTHVRRWGIFRGAINYL